MPILPLGMLHLFDELEVEDAFILPQFWNIPEYREFYTGRKWTRVIVDNGLYEKPDAHSLYELAEIADSLNSLVTHIVGPEKIGDGEVTTSLMLNAIAEHGPRSSKWALMSVFQGTPLQMYQSYDTLKEYRIGFAFPVSMYRQGWSRAGLKFFTGIRNHYVHALGIDDLTELPDIVRAGFDSFDSSIVATAAINGIDILGSELRVLRRGQPDDPVRVDLTHRSFDEDIIDATACNIDDINSTIGTIRIEAKGV
jgi:hypothetical protein